MASIIFRRFRAFAAASVAVPALLLGSEALAQDQAPQAQAAEQPAEDEIIITGTLIRGSTAPGTQSITVDQEQIEATGATSTTQLLADIPQSATFNGLPIMNGGQSTQVTVNKPNLRNLPGASGGGASTLMLVDGHRLPGMGIRQTVPDLDAIAPGAIERVEIVPDGGSSIYGADAVGGVINFITRKEFDGVEVRGRYGFAEDYQSAGGQVTVGQKWDGVSAYVSYDFSWHDSLYGRDRDYVQRRNWQTGLPFDLSCNPGNVVIGASIYALPNLTLGTGNRCDISDTRTFYPDETRHNVLAGISVNDGGPITFNLRAFYMRRVNEGDGGPKTATVSISPNTFLGAPNPFYRSVGGANGSSPQQVNLSFEPITGAHSNQRAMLETWGFTPSVNADLGDGWQLRWFFNFGTGRNTVRNEGVNGGLLSNLVGLGMFDPYNVSNPANAPFLHDVTQFLDFGTGKNTLANTRAVLDGTLVHLPGGDLKIAVGTEYFYEKYEVQVGTAIAGAEGNIPKGKDNRNTYAVFGEMQVPIFGADNRSPGLYSLILSASGRYDHYSDFGGTFNPNFGVNYQPVQWVTLRGKWGKSFQAPSLADGVASAPPSIFAFPFVLFANPAVAPIPGQAQIFLGGGGFNLKPQKATSWEIGAEIRPPFLPGLHLEATYYKVSFKDLIDIPPVFNPSVFYSLFTDLYIMNPTQAQVLALAATAGSTGLSAVAPFVAVPGQVYAIADGRRTNLARVKTDGIDFAIRYDHDTSFGSIYASWVGNYILGRKDQAVAGATPFDRVELDTRLRFATTVGARIGDLTAQAVWRHSGGYNIDPTPQNLNQSKVGAFNVVDLFFEYDVNGSGIMNDLAFTLNVENIFNTDPPLYRGSLNNNDGFANGATVGRQLIFGVRKKF